MMAVEAKSCLIVDDDEVLRTRLGRAIEARGYQVMTAADGDAALAIAASACPDMAIIDLKMPGMNGLELLTRLREQCATTRVVVLTGFGSIANAIAAIRAGAVNYVTKPADATEILAAFDASPESDLTIEEDELQAPSLAEAEWNHIQRILDECGGNISQAAKLLDIPRRTLQRKLKKRAP
ncbi:response regulator transcription factor [Planctomyces sp. SH-PL14]|uniref:response regulator transcription factor n=1 Tax=Planctomyces sp. SH-PL14 TaxID=1632864 RepID=UPI00078E6758|nr:response regulator [Planctomyces sp. SH-PL14]AMV18698.1 Photosynthetic apparatus regulatory protein RegA [Planctomyces sp. SH-PL14]